MGKARVNVATVRRGVALLAVAIGCLGLPVAASAAPGDLSFAQCFDEADTNPEIPCANTDGLEDANSVAVSADGRSVYAAGRNDDAIVNFNRDPATGALTFAQCFDDDDGADTEPACVEVDGLDGVIALTVSADGGSVYAASELDDTVVNFDRNPDTGGLTFSQCFDDTTTNLEGGDCAGRLGLEGANAVAVSPDGNSVYAASSISDAVVNFNRDPGTGGLSGTQCLEDNDPGTTTCTDVNGLDNARSLAISPDGGSLYVASVIDDAVVNFNRNRATGILTTSQCFDDNDPGSEVACTDVDGLNAANGVAPSPDGRSLYVSATGDDSIVNFDRNAGSGALTYVECFKDVQTGNEAACADVVGLTDARAAVVSADGASMFAGSLTDDGVVGFDRNPLNGSLSFARCVEDNDPGLEATCPDVDGLDGVESVALSADGRSIYAAAENDDALVNFNREPATDPYAASQCFDEADTNPEAACANVDGLQNAVSVATSADGRSVYAVSSGDDAIVNFDRNPATGALTFAQCLDDNDPGTEAACTNVDGLNGATSVSVSPDGRSVLVAANGDDAIVNFNRNPVTGVLTFLECFDDNDGTDTEAACSEEDGLDFVSSVAVSGDSRSAYAGAFVDDTVVGFTRNPATGALAFQTCFDDNDGVDTEVSCTDVDGLNAPTAVAPSADGSSLYVTSSGDNSVVNFDRSQTTGSLGFSECFDEGDTNLEAACAAVDGLDNALGVASSPDGSSLYTAASDDDAIVNFDRDPDTGDLGFSQCLDDGDTDPEPLCANVDGLDGAADVATSLTGTSVFSAAFTDDAVVALERNPTTGVVAFSQCFDDNDPGAEAACTDVDGLNNVEGVAASPDGGSAYTASQVDSAVVHLRRTPVSPVQPPTDPPPGGGGGGGGAAADTDPPETTIDKGPKKKSAKRKAKFSFSADESGSSFECKLDKGDFAPCSSPFKKKIKPGKHTFEVRAKDTAGNTDPTPAALKFKVTG